MKKNKVLVIWASIIKKEKSYSYELCNKFLEYYKYYFPNDEISFLDLNKEKVGKEILTNKNFSKFFNGSESEKQITLLKSVDKVIVVSPSVNFNVPVTLKNYLDHILVSEKTFSYKYSTDHNAVGLLKHLKVQILLTQGAPVDWYPWNTLEQYLEYTWRFIGAKVNKSIMIAGTKIVGQKEKLPKDLINEYDEIIKKSAENFM